MTKKKKKKWATPLALLALLIVLLVAYAALTTANRRAEEEASKEQTEEVLMIAEYDSATATALSYTVNGETLSFEKENGAWLYAGDRNFPLNQTIVESMATALSSIDATRSIDEGETADFGLDEPSYLFTIQYEGGAMREYKIGDYNSFNGEYYFMTGSRIYMISGGLLSYFKYELTDMVVKDSYPTDIETDYITSIVVNAGEESYTVEDADEIADLYTYVRQLNFSSLESYYSDAMAEDYGIDGTKSVVVNYKRAVTSTAEDGTETSTRVNVSYTIRLGNAAEDGAVYYSPKDSSMTYSMSAGLYENLLTSAAEPLPVEEEAEEGASETVEQEIAEDSAESAESADSAEDAA